MTTKILSGSICAILLGYSIMLNRKVESHDFVGMNSKQLVENLSGVQNDTQRLPLESESVTIDTPQKLKKVNVKYMLRGYCYASSAIQDTNAFGGFGGSSNDYKKVSTGNKFPDNKVALLAVPKDSTVWANRYFGFNLYLANTSKDTVSFSASDSRLSIVREAFFHGSWEAIEYLPSSSCGNSRHTLYLPPNHYWRFSVPVYEGTNKVKFRFKLSTGKSAIYSNEFDGYINPVQFSNKQGHHSDDIMDPYRD